MSDDLNSDFYEVTIGVRPRRFPTLEESLRYALKSAADTCSTMPAMVWDAGGICVAVVIDDADGLKLHRLIPENWVEVADKRVWNACDATPGFSRQPRKSSVKKK